MSGKASQSASEIAALALASGQTVQQAASAANVTERSVYRWRQEPEFNQRVNELRADLVRESTGRLAAAMADAADKLRTLIDSEDARVALGACRAVIELGVKLREVADLDERMLALEELVNQQKGDAK